MGTHRDDASVATMIDVSGAGYALRNADVYTARARCALLAERACAGVPTLQVELRLYEAAPRALLTAIEAPEPLRPSTGATTPRPATPDQIEALLHTSGHAPDAVVSQAFAELGRPVAVGYAARRVDVRGFDDRDLEAVHWTWRGEGATAEALWAFGRAHAWEAVAAAEQPRVELGLTLGGLLADPRDGTEIAGATFAVRSTVSLEGARVWLDLDWPGEQAATPQFAALWDAIVATIGKVPADAVRYRWRYPNGAVGWRPAFFGGTGNTVAAVKLPRDPAPVRKPDAGPRFGLYEGTFALRDARGADAFTQFATLMDAMTSDWRITHVESFGADLAGEALAVALPTAVGIAPDRYDSASPIAALAPEEAAALRALQPASAWISDLERAFGAPTRVGWRCSTAPGTIDTVQWGWVGSADSVTARLAALVDGDAVGDRGGIARTSLRIQVTGTVAGCAEPARAEVVIHADRHCFARVNWPLPGDDVDAAFVKFSATVEAQTGRAPQRSKLVLAWRDGCHRLQRKS